MPRLTQSQLEYALGGADVLVELTDRTGSGVADTTFVNQVLTDADGEVNGFIALAVSLADPAVDTAPEVLRLTKPLAVYLTWLRGTRAQAMPPEVRQARDDARADLELISQRRRGLGMLPRATSSQPVQQAVLEPDEPWVSATSPRQRLKGMW